jgi:hypothetical protein
MRANAQVNESLVADNDPTRSVPNDHIQAITSALKVMAFAVDVLALGFALLFLELGLLALNPG